MTKDFKVWLSVFALTLSGCINPAGHNKSTTVLVPPQLSETSIPILPVNTRYATIPVNVNGSGPYRFVMDTGASFTVLFSSPGIESLDLDTSRNFRVGGSGTGKRPRASLAEGLELDVAGVRMLDRQAVFFPWQNIPFFPSADTVFWDGILGYDFYSRFAVDVDTRNSTVHLHPPGIAIAGLGVSAVHLPLIIDNLDSYFEASVQAVEGGPFIKVKLHLDTGANNGLSLLKDIHSSFKPDAETKPGQSIGVQGGATTYPSRIATLRLGSLEIKDVQMSYRDKAGSGFDDGEDGRVGVGLLARFRYIVNYPEQELILIPYADSLEPTPHLPRTGLSHYAFGEDFDRLVVTNARYGAEDAGIRKGDIISSIGGLSAYEIARSGLRSVLEEKSPGDVVEVCLQNAAAQDCRDVTLISE